MISRSETRRKLKEALKYYAEVDGEKYFYPMTKFRHATFETVDRCRGIKSCEYKLNLKEKICTCFLYFTKRVVRCDYDYKTDKIVVSLANIEPAGENVWVTPIETKEIDVTEMSDTVYQFQPALKVMVRRK